MLVILIPLIPCFVCVCLSWHLVLLYSTIIHLFTIFFLRYRASSSIPVFKRCHTANYEVFPQAKSAEIQTKGECSQRAKTVCKRALKHLPIQEWDKPKPSKTIAGTCLKVCQSMRVEIEIGLQLVCYTVGALHSS